MEFFLFAGKIFSISKDSSAMVFLKIFFFVSLLFQNVFAINYIYPVGVFEPSTILFMCQKAHCTELWQYNINTHQTEQLLSSRFNPSRVCILPDQSGFSFIDNDMLYIKKNIKRSPYAIECYESLYNIHTIQWIDNWHCCFSAQYLDHFGIFELDCMGNLGVVYIDKNADCLYPQVINSSLFFIHRTCEHNQYTYRVMKSDYKTITVSEQNTLHDITYNPQVILKLKSQPILFLYMYSENYGFFLSYSNKKNEEKKAEYIPFQYFSFTCEGEKQRISKLFDFAIPTHFLVDEQKLFESILPLLPRLIGNNIYFLDASRSISSEIFLYKYNLVSTKINFCDIASDVFLSIPIQINRHMFGSVFDKGNFCWYCLGEL